jgi:hypothetical protein
MSNNKTGNLAHIRSSATTSRVLNLVQIQQRNAEEPGFADKPLFLNSRLNASIIIKHSPRMHERSFFDIFRSSATKIIFPIDRKELQLGGMSMFVEEVDARKKLAGFLGVPMNDLPFERDYELLRELSEMASFDPYLLRERVLRLGRDVHRAYFAISDADIARISDLTRRELERLVRLAFSSQPKMLNVLTQRLNDIFLNDESDEALAPLTSAMGLPAERHHETMFCWKGFIYYKWQMEQVITRIPVMVSQLRRLRVTDARPADKADVASLIFRIADGIEQHLKDVQKTIADYDLSFAGMVEHQRPADFQRFLMNAPQAFDSVGQSLSRIMHIASFWDFRFKAGVRLSLTYDDAMELLEDFAHQLSIYEVKTAA